MPKREGEPKEIKIEVEKDPIKIAEIIEQRTKVLGQLKELKKNWVHFGENERETTEMVDADNQRREHESLIKQLGDLNEQLGKERLFEEET